MTLPHEWWGLVAGLIYGTVGYFTGERYPFSGYTLYAAAADRTHGSVPIFFADDVESNISQWVQFEGIDPEGIHYNGIPCSHQWMVLESRRWVAEHQATGTPANDTHPVAWGYRHYRITPEGKVSEEVELLVHGRAQRR